MSLPKSVAVFCGSKPGVDPQHLADAEIFGRGLAARQIRLIYGGGRVGLMGAVADAVTGAGGKATGVIPDFLMRRELGNTEIEQLEVTDSMHSRKRRMFELSDAFVSLAGGLGTLDETVEIITWRQLGLHDKPVIVLDRNGFWSPLSDMVAHFVDEGYAYAESAKLFTVVPTVEEVLELLETVPVASGGADPDKL